MGSATWMCHIANNIVVRRVASVVIHMTLTTPDPPGLTPHKSVEPLKSDASCAGHHKPLTLTRIRSEIRSILLRCEHSQCGFESRIIHRQISIQNDSQPRLESSCKHGDWLAD